MEMYVPIEKIKVLDKLPSYILAGVLKQTKYCLSLGRADHPYVWFIGYTNQEATYYMVFDKDLYSVTLTMLAWFDEHKGEFDVGY